jgi:hypothetical protein
MVMKAKITLLVLSLVLLAPAFLAAQAVTTVIRGTELFDPSGQFLGLGEVGQVDNPGVLTCTSGALPNPDPTQPPCPTGSRIIARGTQIESKLIGESNDAWLTGTLYVTGNSDMDSNATGHAWGTFRIELGVGGVWEGTWTGKRSVSQAGGITVWTTNILGVGRGTSGDVAGKQLQFTEVITSFMPVSMAYTGTIAAKVLEPPPSE